MDCKAFTAENLELVLAISEGAMCNVAKPTFSLFREMNSLVSSDPSSAICPDRPVLGRQLVTKFTKKCVLLIFILQRDLVKTQKRNLFYV